MVVANAYINAQQMDSSGVSIVNAAATISLKNLPWPKVQVQALHKGCD